jgi:hypothetical protein
MIFPRRFPYQAIASDARRIGLDKIAVVHTALTNITEIDATALDAWEAQWLPVMPPGEDWSDWDWRAEMRRWRGSAGRFDAAIWSNGHLCGLIVGRSSRRRQSFGVRVIQGSPVATHPLKGHILDIAIDLAVLHGTGLGCTELRLLHPVEGMVARYTGAPFGFRLVQTSLGMRYCVRPVEVSDDHPGPSSVQ